MPHFEASEIENESTDGMGHSRQGVDRLTTPRMNRIFTITASRELTADTLLAWRFGTYSAEPFGRYIGLFTTVLPSLGRYAWVDRNDSTFAFEDVDTAQEIVDADIGELELGRNSVNDDATANSILPIPGNVLEHAALVGMEVRFAPANEYPDNYVSFVSDGRADYPTNDAKFGEFFFIRVRPGTIERTGNDFTLLNTEEVIVTVEGQVAASSLADSLAFPGIWGELNEQGISQAISATGDVLTTSSQQTASLIVRYRSDLLAGTTVTDDLQREWRVTSSRPIRDRRYVLYELARVVQAAA